MTNIMIAHDYLYIISLGLPLFKLPLRNDLNKKNPSCTYHFIRKLLFHSSKSIAF